jgi:type 1 glutamine amidotransferase
MSSDQHGGNHAFKIVTTARDHPVMNGFPDGWQNHPDELYQIKKVWPDCVPLAKGVSATEGEQVCVWVNQFGRARVFGTTLGHGNETMGDKVFLDLVTRGLLWACGKLNDDGTPGSGFGKDGN